MMGGSFCAAAEVAVRGRATPLATAGELRLGLAVVVKGKNVPMGPSAGVDDDAFVVVMNVLVTESIVM